ncbi:MAG TPA: type III-B CRISPR module RAMP protein Cmr4 [Nitrospiraceae bacterium]|nr:type III-B CRISPR module RAMP protein Cmr4 [Nitrospiraceae bacterium]
MSSNPQPYDVLRYFVLALDPIHVGTGGYRLGRVDMSIVREPGTNLPKIPGTSLSGACRTYAAMAEGRYRWQQNGKTYVCAGAGQPDEGRKVEGHCGKYDCPVCVTFGFTKGDAGSFQGLAQFSDARLIFFPVHSLAGPVWVTCPGILSDLGISESVTNAGVRVANGVKVQGKLNLGWLMLSAQTGFAPDRSKLRGVPEEVLTRAVLVSNKLFGQIVNDNLEVRTSVSIDPSTGAAADQALFTYEALPRASVLAFDVVSTDPKFYLIAGQEPLKNAGGLQAVKATIHKGLRLFEPLGIGGMNTRGMGRLKVLGFPKSGGTQ